MKNNIYVGGQIIDQWGTFKRNKRDIIEEFENDGNKYILTKNFNGFYNKALMYQNENNLNNYVLISYNTIVAEIDGGSKFIVYGYYSETTKRHINAFLNWFGLTSFSKKEIIENENKWLNCKDYVI